MLEINFVDLLPGPPAAAAIAYVGGPRDGTTEALLGRQPPVVMIVEADGTRRRGEYRRSVRCADDGLVRYVWHGT